MASTVNISWRPSNGMDLLHSQIYGLSEIFGRFNFDSRRPPLALDSTFANAVAYSKDAFHVHSQDSDVGIPALSIGFANHPNFPHLFVLGDEEGVMYVRNTSMNAPPDVPVISWKVSRNAIFAFKFVPEDPQARIVAATGDKNLVLFEPIGGIEMGTFEGHTGSVKSLDFQKDTGNSVFASGARDGHVLIWDIRSGFRNGAQHPVSFLANAHSDFNASPKLRPQSAKKSIRPQKNCCAQLADLHSGPRGSPSQHSIPDVVFQDRNVFITTGTADGTIKFWDLRNINVKKPTAFHTVSLGTSFSSLCLDRSRTQLFATAKDKYIYLIDAGPRLLPYPLARYAGADISSFYIKCSLSLDEEILACGSRDGNAFLFKVKEPEAAPLMLVGHQDEVMTVAFNQMDPYQMATNGDDNQVLLWHAESFLDRSDKNKIVGEAKRDDRIGINRSQKRISRQPLKPIQISSSQPVASFSQKSTGSQSQRSSTPPPTQTGFSSSILRTPDRGLSQPARKRLRNMTISPFLAKKSVPRTK